MYTHVSKCKNDKIKGEKLKKYEEHLRERLAHHVPT
jgi:hypothetical protein